MKMLKDFELFIERRERPRMEYVQELEQVVLDSMIEARDGKVHPIDAAQAIIATQMSIIKVLKDMVEDKAA